MPWLIGTAGVLAVAGVTTALVAIDRNDTASDLRAKISAGNQPTSQADAYDAAVSSRDHFADATWVFGAGAVVAGAAALALYFFDEPSAERLRVTPIASPAGAGAMISGHF